MDSTPLPPTNKFHSSLTHLDKEWREKERAFKRQKRRSDTRKIIAAGMIFGPGFMGLTFGGFTLENLVPFLVFFALWIVLYIVIMHTNEAYRWPSRYEVSKGLYEKRRAQLSNKSADSV